MEVRGEHRIIIASSCTTGELELTTTLSPWRRIRSSFRSLIHEVHLSTQSPTRRTNMVVSPHYCRPEPSKRQGLRWRRRLPRLHSPTIVRFGPTKSRQQETLRNMFIVGKTDRVRSPESAIVLTDKMHRDGQLTQTVQTTGVP
jgi:hypothetical protein